jgi:hypothetical protein
MEPHMIAFFSDIVDIIITNPGYSLVNIKMPNINRLH